MTPNAIADRRVIAPYVTAWTEERDPSSTVVMRRGVGIAYEDERVFDRDEHGVLWSRTPSRPGCGRPDFGRVHPLRQRHAMRLLLCQVCASPADRTDEGVLWLLKDHRADWLGWPNRMGVSEPPVCVPCVRLSVRLCPALRNGAVAIRAGRYPIAGVNGALYRRNGLVPVAVGQVMVEYGDPRTRWIRAAHLIRRLSDCVTVPLESLVD